MTDDAFDAKMQAMPVKWRYHFCGGDPRQRDHFSACCCLGCVNNSGQLGNAPETYDQWVRWVAAHPKPPMPADK